MASWHGHRDDADIPEVVQGIWKEKFRPGSGDHSNVDACVLDADGKVVRTWDAMPMKKGGRPEPLSGGGLAAHWRTNLEAARKALGLGEAGEARPVSLPALPEGTHSGLRVFTRLDDPGMPAYFAPIVELVPMGADEWAPLARPAKKKTVDASGFLPWLSKMFPGGVMERTDPVTKRVYEVNGASGELTFEPAGAKFALLHGKVTLTDSGGGDFSYSGELRVVVEYKGDETIVKGVFEGKYPRRGPQGGFTFDITGVIESVSK